MQEVHVDVKDMIQLVANRMMKTYYLLGIACDLYYDMLSQQYQWLDRGIVRIIRQRTG